MMKYKCIDLFCGAGGMSYGFERAGFNTIFAVEFNEIYANTYKLNFKNTQVHIGDIKQISDEEILSLANNKVDIIIGGPPCQGFSIAGNIARKFLDDERNHLFLEYVRFCLFLFWYLAKNALKKDYNFSVIVFFDAPINFLQSGSDPLLSPHRR